MNSVLFASSSLSGGEFLAPLIILAIVAPLVLAIRAIDKSYFAFDRRTLGLTRILLGWFLITDLFRRGVDWEAMFGDKGVLPSWVVLNRPSAGGFSLLHGFTSGPELWVLFFVILATYVCLFVGYKTKIAQILSVVFVTSMNGRVLLIENGGYVIHNLLLLWTAFLPLGDRFSVDAMLASMRRKRETSAAELNDRSDLLEDFRLKPFFSLVGLVVAFQIAVVYYFNVVHKTGPAWKKDFTAVHYVMWVDRMVNPLIGVTREYVPPFVYRAMTALVVFSEAALPFCVTLPKVVVWDLDVRLWLRRLAIVLMNFLHIGFGSTFVLGPFAWALCIMSTLLFAYEDWEVTIAAMKKKAREITVVFDPRSGAALFFCRVLARLDRFSLIGFDEAAEAERAERIVVLTADGKTLTGSRAIGAIVLALPIGPAFAWMFDGRFAILAGATNALLGWAKGRASKLFGLGTSLPAGVETSPLRYHLKKLGGITREVLCAAMFLAAINQALVELWSTKKPWGQAVKWAAEKVGTNADVQPEATRLLTHKPRFLQGWFMFSPNPVMDDGTIIVDAITVDGRHVDPFWNEKPSFDLLHVKSYGYNQIWSDYFNRMHMGGNKQYRDSMIDYMRRLPERTGNPNDALVSGEVYWVRDMNPRFGSTESYAQANELLFVFGETGGAKEPKNAAPEKPDS
ncbi:MAG: HTTM domain-containing protein [Myxococcales bacterium]|nr:HTTM domain-containing protein [Myxococcales bacterium]